MHNYNTRFSCKASYAIPKVSTNYGIFNTRFQGAKIWNEVHSYWKILIADFFETLYFFWLSLSNTCIPIFLFVIFSLAFLFIY